MRILIVFLFFISFCTTCKIKREKVSSSENFITELLIKYPQLGVNYVNEKVSFNLTRLVTDKLYEVEFELHDAIKSNAGIIIIRNESGSYALPLFKSDQTDFWEMDSSLQKDIKHRVNTTFQEELKKAIRKLNIESEFFFTRYLFEHVLLLRESSYPDPCSSSTDLPMQALYQGRYIFIMTLYKRDSMSLECEFPAFL